MNEIVKYHNDLSNQIVIKTLNGSELNVLMALCSKMRDKDTNEVVLNFQQLKKLIKWENNNNELFIKNLINMNKKLISLNFTFRENKRTTQFVLFPTFVTDEINKTLTVRVNKDFSFLLNNISSNFTRFELDNFTDLKSKYSKYLYKELMKFKNTGYLIFPIDDFRNRLDIPNSYKMINIDKRVLEPVKEELSKILKNFEIKKIKKGKSISHIEFYFSLKKPENDIINIDSIKTKNIVEINTNLEVIKKYWISNFNGVNFTKKHQVIIDKLLKNNSIDYIKDYLKRLWDFVLTDKNVLDKQAYFSKLILDKKDISSTVKPNIPNIDIQNDKEQADKFMNELENHIPNFIQENLYDMEKRLDNLEVKKDIDTETSNLKEITQAEFDKMYFDYLKNNNRVDSIVQKVVFKGMTSNKYKIIEKKKYTIDDIPKEELLSKNGKNLSGMALKNKIEKILKKMNS